MRKQLYCLFVFAVIFLSFSNFTLAATNLNDGQSYTFGSEAGDDIYLGTGETIFGGASVDLWNPSTPGTHLNLADGGVLSGIGGGHTSTINMSGGIVNQAIQTYDNCQLTVTGGFVNGIVLFDNSSANVSNAETGSINARNNASITVDSSSISEIGVRDNSSVIVNGGLISYGIDGNQNASITMNGGSTDFYATYGDSSGFFNGGIINEEITAAENSSIIMTDGTVQLYLTKDNGFGIIEGGVVESIVSAFDDSHIDIKGGEMLDYFRVLENAQIKLYGSDFYINGESIGNGEGVFGVFGETLDVVGNHYEFRITGTLADGSLMDNEFHIHNTGDYAGTADILIVPEPSSLVLLGMGLLSIFQKRGRQ